MGQGQLQAQEEQQQQDEAGTTGCSSADRKAGPALPYAPYAALNFWLSCVPLPEEAQVGAGERGGTDIPEEAGSSCAAARLAVAYARV